MVAAVVLGLAPAAGLANQDGGNDGGGEQRDTQSRNEQQELNHILLRFGDGGLFDVRHIVLIQTRFVHVTDTFSKGIGIDFDNLDRVDISDIPLFGDMVEAPLRGEDLTEDNRVGAVYRGADGTLVAVLDDKVDAAASEVSVVNGAGRYVVLKPPQPAQIDMSQLGELGRLRSVQTLVTGEGTAGSTIVLGGLTQTSVPEVEDKVPLLGDIPVLRQNFLGNAYKVEDTELVILIKPTIITTGDD